MRVLFIGSATIDIVNGQRRCGGSAIFGVIPFIIKGTDFHSIILTCKDQRVDVDFEYEPVFMDDCLVFKHTYHGVDNRESVVISHPRSTIDLDINADKYDLVIINTLFGELNLDSVERLLHKARFSAVDLQGFIRRINSRGEVEYLKPSERVLRVLSKADVIVASSDEYSWDPVGNLFILTMGSMGAKAFYDGRELFAPTVKVDRIAIGTGDMFISSFSTCYLEEGKVDECLVKANAIVSALLEHIEFTDRGCINYEKLRHERKIILDKAEKRREQIRMLID